jgi:choline dehydrogenase-like flavoprotein
LELSGVGNPAILKAFGIDTVVDLPGVGENLQEHPYVVSDFTVHNNVFTFGKFPRLLFATCKLKHPS